jgi:hypothetical protein
MTRLTHPNGVVVNVAQERVDRLVRYGFTTVEKPKAAPVKKATKATKK